MEGSGLNECNPIGSSLVWGQHGRKASVVAACEKDMSALVEIHEKPELFYTQ